MNEVLLERAFRDLNRIENGAAQAGGDFRVGLPCDMAADKAREQLAILKRDSQKTPAKEMAWGIPQVEALLSAEGRVTKSCGTPPR